MYRSQDYLSSRIQSFSKYQPLLHEYMYLTHLTIYRLKVRDEAHFSLIYNSHLLDQVFVKYVITWLWVRAGSYYIGYVSS